MNTTHSESADTAPASGSVRRLRMRPFSRWRAVAVAASAAVLVLAAGVYVAVRSQLRQVLQKTGCTRQAEVVSLLANVTLDRSAKN